MISFDSFIAQDGVPIYLQIVKHIKSGIVSGTVVNGDEVPQRRVLSALLGVNPNTIQKAYKELENEGYIYSLKAKGNFVSSRKEVSYSPRAAELTEAVAQQIRELRFMGIEEKTLQALISQIYKE